MTLPSASAHFQPLRSLVAHLAQAFDSDNWDRLDVPVAYAVLGGVHLLQERLSKSPHWSETTKRFLVGVDWFRTEPIALDLLAALPNTELRIVDGKRIVKVPGCRPARSYHPKAFILSKAWPAADGVIGCLLGSGNLSRNGLSVGHELDWWSCSTGSSADVVVALSEIYDWFESLWLNATPYSEIQDDYRAAFQRHQRTQARSVTDDDSVPDIIYTQRGLSPEDLVTLRSFDRMWIDTGSMYGNLGQGRSGNQLDLKRYTRVFFGFPASDLPANSPIGAVTILVGAGVHSDRHLRYGDNQMDKLDLPVPASAAVDYRNQTLLLTRTAGPLGRACFRLEIAGHGDRSLWRSRSVGLSALFRFGGSSVREFGVF